MMQANSGHNSSNPIYEEYRRPVVKHMENYINQINEDLKSISPILDKVFDKAKLYHPPNQKGLNLKPAVMLHFIQSNALTLLKAILRQTKKFEEAKHHIDVEKAIFVIGSGFSFESDAPMNNDLNDILSFIGASGFPELRKDSDKCYKFKEQFKSLIDRCKPGMSHKLLAKNFPSKVIEIICLNWDNLIERSFKDLGKNSRKINKESQVNDKNHLWKFHGDLEKFNKNNQVGNLGWVFPDEKGHVFNCFMEYMNKFGYSSQLFSLFIVGYSESDVQVKEIINELETTPKRPTYRIGMDISKLKDCYYLLGPSAYVLTRILS